MRNRILIFGKGFIGSRIHNHFKCNITAKRIHKYNDIQKSINKFKPNVIINCIGSTGTHNVGDCEKNIDSTIEANTFIPILMAEAAVRNNLKLVHISSGCIYHYDYQNQKPITEKVSPDYYKLLYSRTKIYAENILKELSKENDILIARIRIPLDYIPNPKNIINKLIKYKKIIDIPNSVTYIPDFLNATEHLINIDAKGIYNIVAKGGLRYPYLMDEYKKYRPDFKYSKLPLKKLGLERTNLLLSTRKLENTGFKVRSIKTIVQECMANYIDNER